MKEKIKITELEKDFIDAMCEGDCMYLDHIEGYLEKVKINQVSGIVSSLVKKGIIESFEEDVEFNFSSVKMQVIQKITE